MEKIIDIKKTTKKELFDLLRTLHQTSDHYIVKENGRFLAVVIPREEYEKYLQQQQARAQVELENFLAKVHSRIDQSISDEDLMKEIDDAIHEMRGIK